MGRTSTPRFLSSLAINLPLFWCMCSVHISTLPSRRCADISLIEGFRYNLRPYTKRAAWAKGETPPPTKRNSTNAPKDTPHLHSIRLLAVFEARNAPAGSGNLSDKLQPHNGAGPACDLGAIRT